MACHITILILLTSILAGFTVGTKSDYVDTIVVFDMSDSAMEYSSAYESYLEDIVSKTSNNSQVGVVLYGNGSIYAAELTSNMSALMSSYHESELLPDASASNLSEALYYASSLFAEDGNQRILLISDGVETDGDALAAAKELADENIRIDALYLPTSWSNQDEVQLSQVTLPDRAEIGEDRKSVV